MSFGYMLIIWYSFTGDPIYLVSRSMEDCVETVRGMNSSFVEYKAYQCTDIEKGRSIQRKEINPSPVLKDHQPPALYENNYRQEQSI